MKKVESKNLIHSFSKKNKDGKDLRVEVREIKNGFIIRKTLEWNDSKKGWQYENEEWFSKEAPFIKIEDKNLTDLIDK